MKTAHQLSRYDKQYEINMQIGRDYLFLLKSQKQPANAWVCAYVQPSLSICWSHTLEQCFNNKNLAVLFHLIALNVWFKDWQAMKRDDNSW